MMVKVVSMTGEVKTLDWVTNYKALRKALDIEWPGLFIVVNNNRENIVIFDKN